MAAPRTFTEDDAPVARRTRWSSSVGPGMVVGVVATVALVVSMFMSWRSGGVHPNEIPAAFLWDRDATGDPSLLVFLIPLTVLLGIGSVLRGGSALRVLAGLLTMVVVGLYAYHCTRWLTASVPASAISSTPASTWPPSRGSPAS